MFLSPNILLRGMKYWFRKQLYLFENERLISLSSIQFGSWFPKKITTSYTFTNYTSYKLHISSWWCMHAPNVNKTYKKFFQPFTLPLCGLVSVFYWSEHVYTYRSRQEFSKHSWKKNMQLFWKFVIYLLKNVKHVELNERAHFTEINSVAYFLSFHSLSVELELVISFLSSIIGVSNFPIFGRNFPQSHSNVKHETELNCLISDPTMIGGEEYVWFLDALKHLISELILPEKTWKGIKTVLRKILSYYIYLRTPEFGHGDHGI